MKVNKSITDKGSSAIRAGGYGANKNRVDPKYFRHFCKWMVEYVKLHDRQGVPFYAVSPGNEVQFSQSFESCVWDDHDFVTWQITERNKSTHRVMVMDNYTPKTYAAMHYAKFIRPDARRIDAQPGFGTVQVGASLHENRGDLAVVAINPTDQEETLHLTLQNFEGLASLKAYRTSVSENLKTVGEVAVKDQKVAFEMTPQSIVTFSDKIIR